MLVSSSEVAPRARRPALLVSARGRFRPPARSPQARCGRHVRHDDGRSSASSASAPALRVPPRARRGAARRLLDLDHHAAHARRVASLARRPVASSTASDESAPRELGAVDAGVRDLSAIQVIARVASSLPGSRNRCLRIAVGVDHRDDRIRAGVPRRPNVLGLTSTRHRAGSLVISRSPRAIPIALDVTRDARALLLRQHRYTRPRPLQHELSVERSRDFFTVELERPRAIGC